VEFRVEKLIQSGLEAVRKIASVRHSARNQLGKIQTSLGA
jgi:hypothetical protein